MILKFSPLFLSLSLFSFYAGFAQVTHSVHGTVVDEHQVPLEYVNVLLLAAEDSCLVKGSVSSTLGEYEILSVPEGSYLLQASMLGYKKAYSSIFKIEGTISEEEGVHLPPLVMEENAQALAEVVVRGQRPLMERKLDRLVLNVQNSVISSGGNAMEILQKAPGVIFDKDGNISLRGKQGVVVMVDGKPTNLTAGDVENLLKNIPGTSIDRVEIMTNPSAKYEAAGNAGIINIISRKNENEGWNSTTSIGWEYGRYSKYNAGLDLNYRNGRLNVYGNYHYSQGKTYTSMDVDRLIELNGKSTLFDQSTFYALNPQNHYYKGGLDYNLGENEVLGFLFSGFRNTEQQHISNETFILQSNRENDSTLLLHNLVESRWRNQTYNLNYRRSFKAGSELSFDADYSLFRNKKLDQLNSRFYDHSGEEAGTPFLLSSNIPSLVEIKSLKADYSHVLANRSKLELGVKSSMVSSDNIMEFDFNQELIAYLEEFNQFKYQENINAVYLNYHKEWGKYKLQLGLRGEHTQSEGNSLTGSKVVDTLYLQWFPSFFISHQVNEKNELNLTYSRRIDRPNYQTLNPFVYFLDLYTNFRGTPFLRPQNTHAVELSHNYKNSLFTTIGYSNINDVLAIVIDQNDSTRVSSGHWINLDVLKNYNLTLSKSIAFTKWWSANNNLNLFYNHYTGTYLERKLDNRLLSTTFNTSHSFILPYEFKVEVSWFYNSPMAYGIERMSHSQNLDIGLRKSFLEEKASLNISIHDVFKTMRYKTHIDFKNMDIDILSRWESRTFKISLNYLFGKKTVKSLRERSTGIENEKNRAGN